MVNLEQNDCLENGNKYIVSAWIYDMNECTFFCKILNDDFKLGWAKISMAQIWKVEDR